MGFKQARRRVGDEGLRVDKHKDGLLIEVRQDGEIYTMFVSGYQASILYAVVGFMLGIPLPKRIGKAIVMDFRPAEQLAPVEGGSRLSGGFGSLELGGEEREP